MPSFTFVYTNKSACNLILAILEPEDPKRLGPKGSEQIMKMILQTRFEEYLTQLGKGEERKNYAMLEECIYQNI